MRLDGRLREPAEPARQDEPCVQIGVGGPGLRPLEEPHHRLRRARQLLDLEVGVEIVGDGEVRVDLERLAECLLGEAAVLIDVSVPVLGHHAVDPSEPRPRGREARVFLEA